MKFLDVPWVFDHAELNRNSRCRSCPCCLPRIFTASASGLYVFAAQCPTPPILYLRFAASLAVAAQDSRPSGSLLLSRKELSSSASCRFSPAHRNGDFSPVDPLGDSIDGMFPVFWFVIALYLVAHAIAGMAIGAITGWIFSLLATVGRRGLRRDAFLGAFGSLAGF